MKFFLYATTFLLIGSAKAQELFVYTEPASNMAAKSIGVRAKNTLQRSTQSGKYVYSLNPEIMWGASKKLMVHTDAFFSNKENKFAASGGSLYMKYRFLSNDGVHSHFRMAAFAEGSYSRNEAAYQELSLDGDQSGVQAGVIATQLLHKQAVSSSVSISEILQSTRGQKSGAPLFVPAVPYEAFNYSLSAGYLVLPQKYTSYDQTNLNLYIELLGQRTTDLKRYFIDLAPAAQLIFNSTAKLNLGYRFQVNSNMYRMSERSWLISFEWLFLDALK